MPSKLLVVMVNTDPARPTEAGAPFFLATVAAAMEYRVEVLFSGGSAALAQRGVAAKLFTRPDCSRSVYDFIKDAHCAGVRFKVCNPAVEVLDDDLIPEVEETVGGAYLISEAMDDETVTFTF
jgi:predicted peroxiredoxin